MRARGRLSRDMSLAQIEYFVAIAEEAHLGRAAERLHISQPPLTRQLKSLEAELGASLFERTPRGMRLLPAGEKFLTHARRILQEVDRARVEVRSAPTARADLAHSMRNMRR
jgi:DNA-binding transcriptional LysR family regulator